MTTTLQNSASTSYSRLQWLDVANVLAMVGVVLFHIPTATELPYREVEFAVVNTCFFFLAGFSFGIASSRNTSRIQSARFLLHRIVRLLIPTIFSLGILHHVACCWATLGV